MRRYADPTRCPDCGATLPVSPRSCPQCGLPLTGPVVDTLFASLQRADMALEQLRSQVRSLRTTPTTPSRTATPSGTTAPASTPAPGPAPTSGAARAAATVPPTAPPAPAGPPPGAQPQGLPRFPGGQPGAWHSAPHGAPHPGQRPGMPGAPGAPGAAGAAAVAPDSGIGMSMVPRILLTLGALSLLVGALTFLAFAWQWLGVGGRTAVLLAFTAAAAAGSLELGRRRLRIGAEALSVVALGLLTMDLLGARAAGWFGEMSDAWAAVLAGGTVGVVAIAVVLATSGREREPLMAPQIVALPALHAAAIGLSFELDPLAVAFSLVVAVLAAIGILARLRGLMPLAVGAAISGALWWVLAAGNGWYELATHEADVRSVLLEGSGVPLLVAALLLPALAFALSNRTALLAPVVGVSALIVTGVLALPVIDEGAYANTTTWSLLLVAWSLAVVALPRTLRPAGAVPALGLWGLVGILGFFHLAQAVYAVGGAGEPFSAELSARTAPAADFWPPLLTLLVAAALLVLPVAWSAVVAHVPTGALARRAGTVLAIAAAVTLAQYTVPAVALVAVGLALTLGAALLAWRARDGWVAAGAGVLALSTYVAALPSDVCTTVVLLITTAAVGLLALRSAGTTRLWALVALPAPTALTLWSAAHVVDAPHAWVPLVLAILLAPLALVRPRVEVEGSVVGFTVINAYVALTLPTDHWLSWLAAYLVVAAVACGVSALLNAERRFLAGVGGILLALALWCRMADLGVDTVEAYTLPAAAALLVLGAELMRRNRSLSSAAGLLIGLLLGILPSLAIVLTTPGAVGWRGALLGVACLVLVVGGVRLRLSAPLVVGAVAGAVVLLRLLGPYGSVVPVFVWLALAGIGLTILGITWEARLKNLRDTGQYLARLR